MVAVDRGRSLRGPLLIALLYAVTLALALPVFVDRWEAGSRLSALGTACGLLGLTGFALNILLGARLPGFLA